MADFLNPALHLDDLVRVFEQGAESGSGMTFDPVLCRCFADGLADVSAQVDALVAYAAADGPAQRVEIPAERPLTPAARRQLARAAVPLDPDGRVVAMPLPARRPAAVNEGGSAA